MRRARRAWRKDHALPLGRACKLRATILRRREGPHVRSVALGYPHPCGANPTRANIARVYDAFLGGQDNYEIDRQVLRRVIRTVPEARDMATENRKFLVRACRFLTTEVGISQFLDCGSGLPTVENTHQVVQRLNPDARVVYVDNDPVVLAYGRALLAENDNTHFASADIFNPREVIDNEVVSELEQLLPGLELVAPGLTLCADWRPEIAQVKPLNQAMYCVAGAVGRKP